MKTMTEQQAEFMKAMGSPTIEKEGHVVCCILARRLIEEEVNVETLPALEKYKQHPSFENLVELADGIIDSVYVLLHAANSLDIPFDLVWNEVHRSNMAKVDADGRVKKREDGKILKPEGWTPPDIFSVMMEYKTKMEMGDNYMRTGMIK